MKGLKPLNKIGAAFGSYGWSGEAVKMINNELEAMKFEIIDPGLRVQYVPDKEALANCYELGRKVARAVRG
jgi:flavorubredoxin